MTHYGICGICDSSCGLAVEHDGTRILSVRGDAQDAFSRGHVCPKAVALKDIHDDPDRLRQPVKRKGSGWERISWDEAIEETGRRIAGIQKRCGRSSVAFYLGNPVSHNYSALIYLKPFLGMLGTRNVYSANSVDAFPRILVSLLLFGNQALLPVPDIERTRHMLILGANPAVSNGSIMTAGDCKRKLGAIRARGGRIVVVDPRRTETAAIADAHHFIRPGTDALFLLSFLHVLFEEGLVRPGRLGSLVDGIDGLTELVKRFPPRRVAGPTGIGEDAIRSIAKDFAAASSAVCYGRMGTCTQEYGTVTTWLIDAVNIVTGNMDRAGGSMFTTPAVDLAGLARLIGQEGHHNRWQSRVDRLPELCGELPAAALAGEIETAGAGQVRGLITLGGNMILSLPNGRRLDQALERLEFMACVDFYINETTRHAHIILPPAPAAQSDHYPLLEHMMAVRNTAHYATAMLPDPPDTRHDWEILGDLGASIAMSRGPRLSLPALLARCAGIRVPPPKVLDLLLALGPHRLSLADLQGAPHGLDLGPLRPRLEKLLKAANRRIPLLPDVIGGDIEKLEKGLEGPGGKKSTELLLVGRRTLRSMNSWLHNIPRLVGGSFRCTLLMHPRDTEARGLQPGAMVKVASRVGEIKVPLEVTEDVMPGVACMAFGWGHDREGARLATAVKRPGSSMNDITDDSLVDRISGTSVLNGIPIRVSAC